MADATGTDILLQLLAGQDEIKAQLKALHEELAKTNLRIDRTNDTITLVASVLHRSVEGFTAKIGELEAKLH